VANSQPFLAVFEDFLSTPNHARDVGAHLEVVLADGVAMEHRVVTDVLNHLDRPDINPAGDFLDDIVADKADLILSEEQTRDDGRSLQRVVGDRFIELLKQRVGKHGKPKAKIRNYKSEIRESKFETGKSRLENDNSKPQSGP
jgi:hypothetical protein